GPPSRWPESFLSRAEQSTHGDRRNPGQRGNEIAPRQLHDNRRHREAKPFGHAAAQRGRHDDSYHHRQWRRLERGLDARRHIDETHQPEATGATRERSQRHRKKQRQQFAAKNHVPSSAPRNPLNAPARPAATMVHPPGATRSTMTAAIAATASGGRSWRVRASPGPIAVQNATSRQSRPRTFGSATH